MDLLDRLLAHDTWTTRQLLIACEALPDDLLDKEFEIDHKSIRKTFTHVINNMELWTDLIYERPTQQRTGDTIASLITRLSTTSRELAKLAKTIARENRFDDFFLDTLDKPPQLKTYGGAIGHLITHSMHHRAQIMFLMEKVGIQKHIEGDLLSWESVTSGWKT